MKKLNQLQQQVEKVKKTLLTKNPLYQLITSHQEFMDKVEFSDNMLFAIDYETRDTEYWSSNFTVIGMAISGSFKGSLRSCYLPLKVWDMEKKELVNLGLRNEVHKILSWMEKTQVKTIYHNAIMFDWAIQNFSGYKLNLHMDTQHLWHMLDNSIFKKYGLKNAQTTLLGWDESNDKALEVHIKKRCELLGISPVKGDENWWKAYMYVGDLEILATYATLDSYSTLEVYNKLYPKLLELDYEDFFSTIYTRYGDILRRQKERGILIDREALKDHYMNLGYKLFTIKKDFQEVCSKQIKLLEQDMLNKKLFKLKEKGREKLLNDTKRHPKFNFGSSSQLGEIFFNYLKVHPQNRNKQGKYPLNKSILKTLKGKHPGVDLVLDFRKQTKVREYLESYIKFSGEDNILHPNINLTATVGGRVAGFKPNILQMPKKDEVVMKSFKSRPGYSFIYGDFNSVEPCVIAHFSKDEAYTRIANGAGCIYLELMEVLFPEKAHLYDFSSTEAIKNSKKILKPERDICKIFQLAIGYGGTEFTICNLLGWPQTDYHRAEARLLVYKYWQKFKKVKALQKKLTAIYKKQGHIRNGFGRILFLDPTNMKDILNRFIQSTGHDSLIYMNFNLDEEIKLQNLDMHPLHIDEHDSCIWEVKDKQINEGLECFKIAARKLNEFAGFDVNLVMEPKVGKTFHDFVA